MPETRPDDARTPPSIALNPALDRTAIAARLAERGRVQIHNILAPKSAERLAHCLEQETPWSFTYFDGEAACIVDHQDLATISRERWTALQRKLFADARTGFSYAYGFYPVQESVRLHRDKGLFLLDFFAFLNGPEMLGLIRDILNDPHVAEADAQATRFGPSQFLTYHNDHVPGSNRRCAYVFNYTRQWLPDWGGYLQFFDDNKNGTEAFAPDFNTLNLFTVPQAHAVSFVTPFAGAYRYAISGWYRGQ
ncbi:proline hydroxylase [Iodidimonas gelatinilytica]|uniref:Proline hydroxylase n=1 Tax=Iodidimonas gelatinilytica TaxID=1236966 RepID=A0A5A7MR29_9PROT|nr:2OG-Fe(II) oxygenase family protein [Iodidimonas gelatinilytica]GEQ98074.1 proline hydroxylase [Iodidimonas gelatinilytica]